MVAIENQGFMLVKLFILKEARPIKTKMYERSILNINKYNTKYSARFEKWQKGENRMCQSLNKKNVNNMRLRPKLIHCGVAADCLLIIFPTCTFLRAPYC